MNISVIGLGKLGSPLAAVLAAKGHSVVGADLNASFVDAINAGRAPVVEPRLGEMIDANTARLCATTDVSGAVARTDVTFVIVPTPSGPDGAFVADFALAAARDIGAGLQGKTTYHLVVLTSTVMPGTTGGQFVPELEKASGMICGRGFGVCYNPEFIAIGNVIEGILRPDFLLIGESDQKAGEVLADLYAGVCENAPPVARMNFTNAELTKITVNAFVTMKISFANTVGEICQRMEGGDADAVTRAVGLDSRIGRKYLKSALGFGGPCFPRDSRAFGVIADRLGTAAELAAATDTINGRQASRVVELARAFLPEGRTVGVLGLSYRPDTGLIEESQSLEIAAELAKAGISVCVYDPEAMPAARSALPANVAFADSADACAESASVVVIATPWAEFSDLPCFARPEPDGQVVIDCWGVVDEAGLSPTKCYVRLGRRP